MSGIEVTRERLGLIIIRGGKTLFIKVGLASQE
jgi:hypothetical protein